MEDNSATPTDDDFVDEGPGSPPDQLEPEGSESEADIAQLDDAALRGVVLAPSDWTVETILNQLAQNSFELDPDFQRRNAWTDVRKSKFIESLMLGLPIPQLILAEREDDDGGVSYVVIDGKQRLLALDAFYDDKNPLPLSGLTVLQELKDKTRPEIQEDPALGRWIRRLDNQTVRTVVIRRWPHESYLHLVFHRINHQTLALSAQELRQALHPGPFTKFADERAGRSTPLHRVLGATQQPDFRMRDVELLVRHLAYRFRIEDYSGNLKRFLDETCQLFNRTWATREGELREAADACDEAIQLTERVFGRDAFRRFTEAGYESRFNRAVFDAMLYYFVQPGVAEAVEESPQAVVQAYEELSREDREFAAAVAATTKTVGATSYRLSSWGDRLSTAVGVPLAVPRLVDRRRIEIAPSGV